jgi:uncharacterized protein YdaL
MRFRAWRLLLPPAIICGAYGILLSAKTGSIDQYLVTKLDCIRVFYDASTDPDYHLGKDYAVLLTNLLGHFPQFQVIVEPIENYLAGQTEECPVSFYIGSYFENQIPAAFFKDFASTKKNVVWMKNSIWKFGNSKMRALFGFEYTHIVSLDHDKLDNLHRPGFYRFITYKGQRFEKFGEYTTKGTKKFNAAFDMVALKPSGTGTKRTILAEAIHNTSGNRLPYAIRSANRFYIADIPFAFAHEADRYLIFADLLFDILGSKPYYSKKKPALFRIEDVSSVTSSKRLIELAELVKDHGIPFSVALIPVFLDPLGRFKPNLPKDGLPLAHDVNMIKTLKKLKNMGATFIWHGITHQNKKRANPISGVSGEDFEFWDATKDAPLLEDSAEFVLNRIQQGWAALQDADILPTQWTPIWEVPHYLASVLDYSVFADVFSWSIGRSYYSSQNIPPLLQGAHLQSWRTRTGNALFKLKQERQPYFSENPKLKLCGQFFPFEIYGDIYGQKIIPENLGYPDLQNSADNSFDSVIKNAKRNRILRDQWASLFFHISFLDRHPDWRSDIQRLIKTIQNSGYEFIDLNSFIAQKEFWQRRTPIFKELRKK